MRCEQNTYLGDIEARFKEAEEFNAQLQKRAAGIQLLQSPDRFVVKTIRTDTRMVWCDEREMPAGEYDTTLVDVERIAIGSSAGAERILFRGRSPNLEAGDMVAAYIFPFTYHPSRITRERVEVLKIMGRLLFDEDLRRIFKEENSIVKNLADKPFDLQTSINQFSWDFERTSSCVGFWLRRPLMAEERAYALAKLKTVKTRIAGREDNVEVEVCGPNSDLRHPYFGIKEALERHYGQIRPSMKEA